MNQSFMQALLAVAALSLGLVLVCVLFWVAPPGTRRASSSIVPWNEDGTLHPRRRTSIPPSPSNEAAACPSVVDTFEQAWAEAKQECNTSVLASGCLGPVLFPPGELEPQEWADKLLPMLDACDLPRTRISLDCVEFPCLIIAEEKHAEEVASCLGSPAPDKSQPGFAILGALRFHGVNPTIQRHIDDRDDYRWKIVRARGKPSDRVVRWLWPGCTEAQQFLDTSITCEQVQELLGCEPAPAEQQLTPEQITEHIQDAHDYLLDLEARCDTFRESGWFLNCEQVPCVLGVSYDSLLARGQDVDDFVCGNKIAADVRFHSLGIAPDRVTLLPMLNIGPDEVRTAIRARWKDQKTYRIEGLMSILGRGPYERSPSDGGLGARPSFE